MSMTRSEFNRAAVLVGAGVVVTGGVALKDRRPREPRDPTGPATARDLKPLASVPQSDNEDPLLRMERELARAMAKPVEQRKWVMVIDQRKCVGCHACTIRCVAENHLPPGVVYRPVVTEETGEYPNTKLRFLPRPCMQYEEPPYVPVCPVKATWHRLRKVPRVVKRRCSCAIAKPCRTRNISRISWAMKPCFLWSVMPQSRGSFTWLSCAALADGSHGGIPRPRPWHRG